MREMRRNRFAMDLEARARFSLSLLSQERQGIGRSVARSAAEEADDDDDDEGRAQAAATFR